MALFDWLTADRPDVREAYEDLKFMLRRGDEMFAAATARLLDNEILDINLEQLDQEINDRERHLRLVVHDHLSNRGDHQLLDMLKLLGVVQEAERIGDLAKTISQIADLAEKPRMGAWMTPYRDLRDRVSQMFGLTRQGFEGRIPRHAEDVLERHERLKAEVRGRIADLAADRTLEVNQAVVMALGIRMIGRTSSHLANIASAVVLPYEDIRRNFPGR